MCVWEFVADETAELVEPQLVCECEVPSDVTDLRFLDEQRIVGSFSNGCVAMFKYKNIMKVCTLLESLSLSLSLSLSHNEGVYTVC